jgi:hypothetical protein
MLVQPNEPYRVSSIATRPCKERKDGAPRVVGGREKQLQKLGHSPKPCLLVDVMLYSCHLVKDEVWKFPLDDAQ